MSNFNSSEVKFDQTTEGSTNGVSIRQNVIADSGNSSSTNLAAGATFTGVAKSTFGIVGLQWSFYATENCEVCVDQSPDGTHWDISYCFDYIASKGGQGETVQATQAYWRLRVTNNGAIPTTTFRLQGVLCPIATPLPSSLSDDARLKTETTITGRENTERHVWVTPTNALSVESPTRLVGTNFDGATKDTNFWTEATANGGTVTQSGEIQLDTSTNAAGSASYTSARKARFVVSSALKFQGLFKFVTAATANNTRRCGAYLSTDGFFFQYVGSTFSIGTRKASSDTLINSGSFNGNYGPNFTPTTTQYYKLEIEWTPKGVFYYVDGKLLHKLGLGHYSNRLTLPIKFENVNSGSTTDVAFDCLGVAIVRLGYLETNPIGKYIGTNATTILKVGAGDLHRITVTDNSGTLLVYDGLSAAGVLMANLDASKTVGTMEFGIPFSDGLTVVSAGTPKMTVVYE